MSHIAIIGTGLVGGSVGLAARARLPELVITGFDRDPKTAAVAFARGAVTVAAGDAAEAVAGAEMVALCVPVDELAGVCAEIRPAIGPDTAITDVGSAKAVPVRVGEDAFGARFVGGHPMAGSERHGIVAADAGLFEGAPWILTPTATTSSAAYGRVSSFVGTLGARPVAVSPDVHDALVARLSHVPQLTASALVNAAAGAGDRDALLSLAASGFRDVTRIAASKPDLWVGIVASNRAAVLTALAGLRARLADVEDMIATGRWDELRGFLAAARSAQLGLFTKPVADGTPVELSMMVPDRPGVLAEVTTAAGGLGLNIEDLRIVHSTEGGRGRLELVVLGAGAAAMLGETLGELGYHVDHGPID